MRESFRQFIGARWLAPLLALIITACAPLIPAKTPPQLDFTPGAPVTVDGQFYDAGVFRVRYPQGWRIVKTNTAEAPMSVVFAAPDETMTIFISADPLAEFPIPAEQEPGDLRRIELENGMTIAVQASAEAPLWDELLPVYERVVTSLSS